MIRRVRDATRAIAIHARRGNSFEQRRFEAIAKRARCVRRLPRAACAQVRPPCPCRRCPERFRCRGGGRARRGHRKIAARESCPCARKARRRPWGRKTCAPRSRADRRRGDSHRAEPCLRTAPRRNESTRPLPRRCAPISSMGWIVPSSLFACITVMRTVSGRSARRTSSGSTTPGFGPRPTGTNGDFNSLPLEFLAGVQDGVMFDRGGDDVFARASASAATAAQRSRGCPLRCRRS